MTPAEWLVACAEGNLDGVNEGLAQGLDPNGEPHDASPLEEAVTNGHLHVVDRLLQTGVPVDHRLAQDGSLLAMGLAAGPLMWQRLLDAGATVRPETMAPRLGGLIPAAVHDNNPAAFRWLLAAGAPLDSVDAPMTGRNGLHVAGWLGHADLVPLLVQAGLDVNAPDATGWTALHWAVRGSHDRAVRALLDQGADVFRTNPNDQSPFDLAQAGVHPTVTVMVNDWVRIPRERAALHALLDEAAADDARGRRRL